jgi:hypothetical protein
LTREDREIAACDAELSKPGGDYGAFLGWADWMIEKEMLNDVARCTGEHWLRGVRLVCHMVLE